MGPRQTHQQTASGEDGEQQAQEHVRVPEGLFVMPLGLTKAVELNGTLGVVTGRYVNGRVGVKFPKPHGVKFVRPEFLVREDGSLADRGEEG